MCVCSKSHGADVCVAKRSFAVGNNCSGTDDAQYADYGFKSAKATDWTDTVTSAETGVGNVAPVLPVAVAAGPANQATNSVGMLPVHSKLAALFMRGVPLKEAVRRGKAIQDMVPTAA